MTGFTVMAKYDLHKTCAAENNLFFSINIFIFDYIQHEPFKFSILTCQLFITLCGFIRHTVIHHELELLSTSESWNLHSSPSII